MKDNHWTGCGIVHSKKTITIEDPRNNYKVTDLSIKITRMIKGKSRTTFIPCECWGVMSEEADNIQEGDFVYAEGHFENKKWLNKDKIEMQKNVIAIEKISVK